jgi:hypothetical protein
MAFIQPNLYVLSGGSIHVTYSTSGINGQPHLTYTSPFISHSFTGSQLTTTASPIGTLVTVTIQMTIDSGSTTFTLLVPRVNLNALNDSVQITTEGITTHHRFSVIPAAMHGQLDTYSVQELTGTASHVEFLTVQTPQVKVA